MGVPNLKQARIAANNSNVKTIVCAQCKKPLWRITIGEQYGTRFAAKKEPFPGVPDYKEYWSKNQQPLRTDCPFCGEGYCGAVKLPNGTFAAVPTVLEWL